MKDPKEIKIIKKGASYSLPVYHVTKEGLQDYDKLNEGLIINFVKGSKNDDKIYRQEGLVTESVLQLLITHLKDLNIGDLENEHTTNAILHLETAQRKLDRRAEDRKNKGVQGTYNK